jgi:long-chain acyl-CoA synthetase
MIRGEEKKTALVSGEDKITYKDLGQRISAFASHFSDLNNKNIAIYSENIPEWIYAFYGIWMNQCIAVPIDFMAGVDDVSFILNDCKPEIIFCSKDKTNTLKTALKHVKYEPVIYILEEIDIENRQSPEDFHIHYNSDDTAVIIYTSGTTGSPKGVMLSYDNLIANIEAVTKDVRIILPPDRLMILLPLHHIFPLIGTLIIPFYIGATTVLCPSLNADDIIKILQTNKINILIGVPRLFSLIRKGIIDKINQNKIAKVFLTIARILKSKTFSRVLFKEVHRKLGGHIRHIVSGGAALDPIIGKDFNALGFDILEGYGMTEAAPMISFTRPNELKPGSAGKIVPGVKVEIRDGEIVASGRNIMQGYYNRPDETDNILKNNWLYTGDLGHIDKSGRIFITGRKKEIIVLSNGKNINPIEIEQKLEKSSELIKEAGVFLSNDKLCAIVVPETKNASLQNEDDIVSTIKNQVIFNYNKNATQSKRILKTYISYNELPRTRLSKIQRFKLEEVALDLTNPKPKTESAVVTETIELKTLIGFLEEQVRERVFPTDSLTDDIALDSLSKVTLLVYIENTFGIEIKEEEFFKFRTVIQLADYIHEKKTRISPEKINWKDILKEKIVFNVPKAGFSFNLFNWSYRAIINTFFRLRTKGSKNIPEGPCIIAANHQSHLDGFVIATLLRRKVMRDTYIYAKEKHWQKWWQRFLARKNNIILMDINKDIRLSIQKMAEVLRKGKNLIIFPEGTRSTNGKLGDFKKTFAILSSELDIPIIPVAINGAFNIFPTGAKFPKLFGKVSVEFLNPVYPLNDSYDALKEKVHEMVSSKL